MEAVQGQIGGRGIVQNRVQRSDHWVVSKVLEERVSGGPVEVRVDGYCYTGSQEGC